jgi:hypothetical protein
MNHTTHPSNTRRIGAPIGWDQSQVPCDALAVTDQVVEGEPVMVSFWRPTAEELAQLAAGGTVSLWIYGSQHPVVAMGVEP